jgi:hypothetical protein
VLYFDIGIAVADRIIEFGQFIRPVCLPFRPVDDANDLKGKFVNLAGWGTKNNDNKYITHNLHIYNLKVCFNFQRVKLEKVFTLSVLFNLSVLTVLLNIIALKMRF